MAERFQLNSQLLTQEIPPKHLSSQYFFRILFKTTEIEKEEAKGAQGASTAHDGETKTLATSLSHMYHE